MLYLITDQEDKTWRDIQWGENVVHEETNSNYHFAAYDAPSVASYMYPAYDGITEPKCWSATGEGESPDQGGFRKKYAKLTTLNPFPLTIPTAEQRITYALVCCLNLIVNPLFRTWAINYLRDTDRTIGTMEVVQQTLWDQMEQELPPAHDYYNCAFPLFAGLSSGKIEEYTAWAVHRAYYDSLEKEPLNLDSLAQIVSMLPSPQIAEALA